MSNNLINQQLPSKKNLTSRILGIISISLAVIGIFIQIVLAYLAQKYEFVIDSPLRHFPDRPILALLIFYYTGVIVLANFGLLKGLKELESSKKRPAVVGIILCLVGLVLSIFVDWMNVLTFIFGGEK